MTTNIAVLSGATSVGKSALTANLGALMAQRGQRVRLTGLDRQRTLSLWYGHDVDPDEGELYSADLLKGKGRIRTGEVDANGKPVKRVPTVEDIERPTMIDGLTVVPEAIELENDAIRLAQLGNVGETLTSAMRSAPPVDCNLYDGPGELNILSAAAIAAADKIIICVSPTIKQVAIDRLLERAEQFRTPVAAVVPNIVPSKRDGGFYPAVLAELGKQHADVVTKQTIRRQHWVDEAYAEATPLPVAFPDAEVTEDYRKLLDELDEHGVTPAVKASTPA
ncbi:ParA family protein [Saccharopolyspora griseoalba]|uniref:ParA family protein n=1 Tax=Saccharopolyspora griseoalba TaxID=1431848 RepID=A0ABW2LR20_9PSEU